MTRTLTELARAFDSVASLNTYDAVAKEVADDGLALVREEFVSSHDPYGTRWDSLQRTSGPRKGGPLYKSGAMQSSTAAQPNGTGVTFSVNTPYAAYHQYGTSTIPVRRMLPTNALGVPPKWQDMINRAFSRVLHRVGGF